MRSNTLLKLICPDEIISAAENEKKEFVSKYISLICSALDVLLSILLFIPVFGNGSASSESVSLFALTGVNPAVKVVFIAIISFTILNGICGMIINKP